MRHFLCKALETSDDEEEEAVSEEEQDVSFEEENDSVESNDEDHPHFDADDMVDTDGEEQDVSDRSSGSGGVRSMPNKIAGDLTSTLKINGKPIKTNNSVADVGPSLNGVAEISSKLFNGELKFKGGKRQGQGEKPNIMALAKPPGDSKVDVNTISVSPRLKKISTEAMVVGAIRNLKERGGSSTIAIKKYILSNYPHLNGPRTLVLIKKFIKKALSSGKLVQSKGSGLGGSFKLSADMNRPQGQDRKLKLKEKQMEKDKSAPAVRKADKTPLASAKIKVAMKRTESTGKNPTIAKKSAKQSGITPTVQLKSGVPATEKAPKKAVAKAAVSKKPQKSPSKGAIAEQFDNGKPTEKPKRVKRNRDLKAAGATNVPDKLGEVAPAKLQSAPLVLSTSSKVEPKTKATTTLPKKATTRAKTAVATNMAGSGTETEDAEIVKPAKKPVGRKAKA